MTLKVDEEPPSEELPPPGALESSRPSESQGEGDASLGGETVTADGAQGANEPTAVAPAEGEEGGQTESLPTIRLPRISIAYETHAAVDDKPFVVEPTEKVRAFLPLSSSPQPSVFPYLLC